MVVDAVLSYHMNPAACGVAKFNRQLANRLGVPMLPLGSSCDYPLLSIKPQEMPRGFMSLPLANAYRTTWDLFLHGPSDANWLSSPTRVYAANKTIADAVRLIRPDIIEAFCPSTVTGNPTRGGYRVLTFGMAHKLVVPHFVNLKAQLEREHPDYTIALSTAVHEGSPWDEALTQSVDVMRAIFGDRLRVLGFLADDALAKELQECDAVAAYFTPALRANNTSAWAALEAGKPLYTNTDADSPALDVKAHSWDRLLSIIR